VEQVAASFLAHSGTPALFALLMLGVFGLPIPDETLMVLAGALIARGLLEPVPTAIAAASGAMAGITASYVAGRFAGLPLLMRYRVVMRLTPGRIRRARRLFNRLGKWLLPVGYFVPGVRHLTAVLAGTAKLPLRTFAAFAYSGAVAWVACFLTLGYVIGERWEDVSLSDLHLRPAPGILVAIVLAIGLGCALWMGLRWRTPGGYVGGPDSES
jgi:membrane protein DedA with SNARE-associated domain